ncbi:MAG: CDP-glucose 4,6-dehydratase [Nitrospirae bacterium]|nr:CDP-glucose 4,6-dehydratase [Nitrospirota bacterium]
MFEGIYKGRRVLVTGHTGFKGSWLCLWLKHLGADVVGYSLSPTTNPNHFELLHPEIISITGDIRDPGKLEETILCYKPEMVFHLAAQSLVRYSYKKPVETFQTNVIGTINVFEACRKTESVKAIVNVTSDKCYENPPSPPFNKGGRGGFSDDDREWGGYRENDPMGGYDPYSASKGCAELVTNCYRNSFFNPSHPLTFPLSHLLTLSPSHPHILLASVRAGNVIGGGDWAEDRLIPDIMRAAEKNEKAIIRNPKAVRPWQHVLEPLSGYLMLGQKLLEGRKEFAEGWNFGPDDESNINVESVVRQISLEWDKIEYDMRTNADDPHEAGLLKLDCSKAHARLNWKPVWDIKKTLGITIRWYKEFYEHGIIQSWNDLHEYIEDAVKKTLIWTK